MELSALQAFIEVARSSSFSEAAQTLFLTQPAVSKRIAALETELDTRLFDRIGRRISLTEAGKALLPRARKLINEAEEMKRIASSISGEINGTLAMATSHHIGLHRLPPVLRSFTRNHPQVTLDIRFMDSEVACRAVETGELELAIVTLPEDSHPALSITEIWKDQLLFVCSNEHPLVKEKEILLERLIEYPTVLPGKATYTRTIIDNAFAEHQLALNIALTTNYLETLKMLSVAGLGWSLLPHSMVDDELHVLDVKDLSLNRSLGTVIHRHRTLSNAARKMIEMCAADIAEK